MEVRNTPRGQGPSINADNYLSTRPANVMHTQDLIGQDVYSSAKDEKIGSLENLVVDQRGDIVGAVIGIGGFLGIGEKTVAIAWDALQISPADNKKDVVIRVNADRESLENAVEYNTH